MCDWYREAKKVARQLGNIPVAQAFRPEYSRFKKPLEVTPGCCLECGNQLSHGEMYPPGRPPRYMCRRCYQVLVHDTRYGQCLLCGEVLPQRQQQELRHSPRELKNAFCPGRCLDYHKVLAGRVLGVQFNLQLPAPKPIHPLEIEMRRPQIPRQTPDGNQITYVGYNEEDWE